MGLGPLFVRRYVGAGARTDICHRRHAFAMLRIAAVLSSLNCILRRNYLAKDRRAQNALLVADNHPSPCSCLYTHK